MGRQAYLNRLALVSFTFLLAKFPCIRSREKLGLWAVTMFYVLFREAQSLLKPNQSPPGLV